LSYAYEAGKWTVLEVLRHIIDCERIYGYRAFRFSKLDHTPLSSFDQNVYITNTPNRSLSRERLLEEFMLVRSLNILTFGNMTDEMLDFKGVINDYKTTARTIGFMSIGHTLHHCNIVRDKYLY
jgi:uncharacterized damage-inducible protein DinB